MSPGTVDFSRSVRFPLVSTRASHLLSLFCAISDGLKLFSWVLLQGVEGYLCLTLSYLTRKSLSNTLLGPNVLQGLESTAFTEYLSLCWVPSLHNLGREANLGDKYHCACGIPSPLPVQALHWQFNLARHSPLLKISNLLEALEDFEAPIQTDV